MRTPIPLAYVIFLKRLILLYCTLLPFGLVGTLNLWTDFTIAVISFVLLGVEEIGSEIEDPFGSDSNDLPLGDICDRILNNVETTITFVPDQVSWENYLLLTQAMTQAMTVT